MLYITRERIVCTIRNASHLFIRTEILVFQYRRDDHLHYINTEIQAFRCFV